MEAMDDSPFAPPVDDDLATLADLARAIERAVQIGINVCKPGVVVSYSPGVAGDSPATVRVRPSFQAVYVDTAGRELPKPLPDCPEAIVAGFAGGGFRGGAAPRPGDIGLLLYCDRSLETFHGGDGSPRDPSLGHTHAQTDAFFLPMARPGATPWVPNTEGWSLSTDTGAMPEPGEILMSMAGELTLEGVQVLLGRGATMPAARVTDGITPGVFFIAWLTQLTTWIAAVHGLPIISAPLAALVPPVVPPVTLPNAGTSEGFAFIDPTLPNTKVKLE